MGARWQWAEEGVGGEVSNIENSQLLGTVGAELCPGHRHSRDLAKLDEHNFGKVNS